MININIDTLEYKPKGGVLDVFLSKTLGWRFMM